MIYPAKQVKLWPRVITAAGTYPEMRTVLIDLMQKGAALTVNDSGGLRLDQGDCVEYLAIRKTKLAPNEMVVKHVLSLARGPHPWELSLDQAYLAVAKRCAEVEEVMNVATAARDAQTLAANAAKILRLHLWAEALARVFMDAGLGHEKEVDRHRAEATLHDRILTAAGQTGSRDPGPYPVYTPDGWFWLTDTDPEVMPGPVDLGTPHGLKSWEAGEPVVTAELLAKSFRPIAELYRWWDAA